MKFNYYNKWNVFHLLHYVLFINLFFCLSVVSLTFADDKNELTDESSLKKIYAQVGDSEKNLQKLEKESNELKIEIKKSQQEIQEITKKKNNIVETRKKNEKILKELNSEIDDLKQKIYQLINKSKGRLRALYRERPIQDFLSFLFSSKSNNTDKILFYVSKIRNYDKKLISDFMSMKRKLLIKIKKQKSIIAKNKVLENELLKIQNEEQVELFKKKSIFNLLVQKEVLEERELGKLRAQALRIETVLKSVTAGDVNLEKSQTLKDEDDKKNKPKKMEAFKGEGLLEKRGKLSLPVNGKVVKHFGKHKVKQFKDFVVSKGIEFVVDKDEKVRVVEKGKVIYVGKMPGYDNILIIDHGKRYYTLYSHLKSIDNNVGEVLDKGDSLGECQTNENGETLFYFELRKDGKPINPKIYFKSEKIFT